MSEEFCEYCRSQYPHEECSMVLAWYDDDDYLEEISRPLKELSKAEIIDLIDQYKETLNTLLDIIVAAKREIEARK